MRLRINNKLNKFLQGSSQLVHFPLDVPSILLCFLLLNSGDSDDPKKDKDKILAPTWKGRTGNPNSETDHYSTQIVSLCREAKVEDGLKVFKEMKSRDEMASIEAHVELVGGLSRLGHLEDAIGIFVEMLGTGGVYRKSMFGELVSSLSKAGHVQQAIKFLEAWFNHIHASFQSINRKPS